MSRISKAIDWIIYQFLELICLTILGKEFITAREAGLKRDIHEEIF